MGKWSEEEEKWLKKWALLLSDKDLMIYFNREFPHNKKDFSSVRKYRQRLGIKKKQIGPGGFRMG
jgi:hypothetical protein